MGEQAEGINPEHHLQKADEFFAAGVQKSIRPGSAKSLWQNMEHEQVEKIFSSDGPGSVMAGFGMEIPDGDHAVFALKDVLFPNDAPVQVSAKTNDCLVAVADVFAVNNPLFRTISGYPQAIVNKGLQELCPEERDCHKQWIEQHPGYYRNYRKQNPDYCDRNRELQKKRDKKCRSKRSCKRDALKHFSDIKPGSYKLIPFNRKRDTLEGQIVVIPRC